MVQELEGTCNNRGNVGSRVHPKDRNNHVDLNPYRRAMEGKHRRGRKRKRVNQSRCRFALQNSCGENTPKITQGYGGRGEEGPRGRRRQDS